MVSRVFSINTKCQIPVCRADRHLDNIKRRSSHGTLFYGNRQQPVSGAAHCRRVGDAALRPERLHQGRGYCPGADRAWRCLLYTSPSWMVTKPLLQSVRLPAAGAKCPSLPWRQMPLPRTCSWARLSKSDFRNNGVHIPLLGRIKGYLTGKCRKE